MTPNELLELLQKPNLSPDDTIKLVAEGLRLRAKSRVSRARSTDTSEIYGSTALNEAADLFEKLTAEDLRMALKRDALIKRSCEDAKAT